MTARAIDCQQPAGVIRPVVDWGRCEGKADCVRVCPERVFATARIGDDDYRRLGRLGRWKLRLHGMQVAYTPNVDACRACGLCVSACPEKAITLARGVRA
jgi:NAD-dependent dihydropyrimidine dehydrogenase PreA subunit